ncbi:SRPBCC family protein [Paenibacillus silvisoli]|uniref:SRPBCC family protein n=1 Tax=Paenibacillus silvisoli TaxID=3110539 RepID=UPI002803A254|nr:SRPBCC domain-containing protein [Paenibacillus silvisoli]
METQNTIPDINQTLVFKAPIQKVWTAVSTAEGLAAWFMPNNLEAVVGHAFTIDAGPFGIQPCVVKEVDEPKRIAFSWGKDWTITIILNELAEKQTECTLIHSGWKADTVNEFGLSHEAIRERMNHGWVGLHQALGRYVEG